MDDEVANQGDAASTASSTRKRRIRLEISTEDVDVVEDMSFPEGGKKAWTVTAGAFCACFAAFELANSTGTFQNWITTHQLRSKSHSSVGWIFGLNSFMTLFCGLMVGPICDAIGTRIPLCVGGALCVLFYGVLGLCTAYWHFMVVVGVLAGLGTSLLFVSSVLTVGQYFSRRRGIATGLAFSGGSVSGIILPIILQHLLPKVGFAWATRVVGLLTLGLVVVACLLVQPRLQTPQKPASLATILPNFKTYRSRTFSAASVGIFFLDMALFIPLAYLPSYALASGLSETMSYRSLTVLNVGSCIGRWLPAYASDTIGRFNTMLLTVGLCAVSTLAIWLPAGSSTAGFIAYALIFGFASGSNLSLAPVCVGQLCTIQDYGRYYTTATFLACFGSLMGNPIAGSLLRATGGHYWGVIVFTGLCYVVGFGSFFAARTCAVGLDYRKKF